ncbi:MAG: DNA repair protein RecO [Lachnospiraceae bacterium]|nr:DNA repair protein RecO [Ruminococcus sp.]MCM1275886.1 DNA repair protein RecO [Lachnospiraceae bacterium]
MLVTCDGIVIGRREIGENSCFIDILTDERGVVEATAHGAKKINSSLLSSAALFSYSTFCLNKTKMRYTVNSAKPKFGFHELGSDIGKLALASYFAQAVKFCTPSEQVQSERPTDSHVRFFAIALYEVLHAGENGRSLNAVKSAFELRYSSMLGFAPNLIACDNCGEYECERGMYFLPRKAMLLCADCFNREYEGEHIGLLPETLFAMRCAVFSPLERCFKFTIGGDAERQLSALTEDYFLYRTERSFTALEYYKSLRF